MTCLSLLHAEPEILTVQEYLILPELRPQIAKTHVYFTRNRIHLVLVYLHLTHQMQFCKSHSIAKRHFCLSCPSEGSGAGGGIASARTRWQSSVVKVDPGSTNEPVPTGCWSLLQGLTHSGLWAAAETWVGSPPNTESLCQTVSVRGKHKATEAGSRSNFQL